MSIFLRALPLWFVLNGAAGFLAFPNPFATGFLNRLVLGFSLPLAMLCLWFATRRMPEQPWLRVAFWAITLGLWLFLGFRLWSVLTAEQVWHSSRSFLFSVEFRARLALGLFLPTCAFILWLAGRSATVWRGLRLSFHGAALITLLGSVVYLVHSDHDQMPFDRSSLAPWLIYVNGVLAILTALALRVAAGRAPSQRTREEAALGLGVVASVLALTWLDAELRVRSLRRRAVEAWAARGLPLENLDPAAARTRENDTYAGLEQGLYLLPWPAKLSVRPAHNEDPMFVPWTERLLDARQGDGDRVPLHPQAIRLLKAAPLRGKEVRRFLAGPPPTWDWNPAAGLQGAFPHATVVRHLSQSLSRAAMLQIADGDEAGAKESLAAALHLYRHYPDAAGYFDAPALLDRLSHLREIIAAQARLTDFSDPPEAIRRDLDRWRQAILETSRWRAWQYLRLDPRDLIPAQAPTMNHLGELLLGARGWPSDLAPPLRWLYLREETARRARALAQFPNTDDSLADEHLRVHRALDLAQALSLLREQAELIRTTRARLAQGLPPEGRPSSVWPGLSWQLTAVPDRPAVTFRLLGAPAWLAQLERHEGEFWLAPLDGRLPWTFHLPSPAPAAPAPVPAAPPAR